MIMAHSTLRMGYRMPRMTAFCTTGHARYPKQQTVRMQDSICNVTDAIKQVITTTTTTLHAHVKKLASSCYKNAPGYLPLKKFVADTYIHSMLIYTLDTMLFRGA
jgi:hypothetical protein